MFFGAWKLEREFCKGASILSPLLFNAYTFSFLVFGSKGKALSLSLLSVWEKKILPPTSFDVRAPFFFVPFWKVTIHHHCHFNLNPLLSFLAHFAPNSLERSLGLLWTHCFQDHEVNLKTFYWMFFVHVASTSWRNGGINKAWPKTWAMREKQWCRCHWAYGGQAR